MKTNTVKYIVCLLSGWEWIKIDTNFFLVDPEHEETFKAKYMPQKLAQDI